jgi:hypothetical protein
MCAYRSVSKNSDFNSEWRKALRTKRFAWQRQRIRKLRNNTRVGPPAKESTVSRTIRHICQFVEMQWLEGRLGLAKSALKIRRFFK